MTGKIESQQPEFNDKAAKEGVSRGVTMERGIATKPNGDRVAMAGSVIKGNALTGESHVRAAPPSYAGQNMVNRLAAVADDPNELARIAREMGVKIQRTGDGKMMISPASRKTTAPAAKHGAPKQG